MRNPQLPEKALLLKRLRHGKFNVPDFIFVPADDFKNNNFDRLEAFLEKHRESFKVIARSAHPLEKDFKGGTFESLQTYADLAGIKYARKKMIKMVDTAQRLSILRQQKFNQAPEITIEDMGIVVMPFIEGASVMAKMIGREWEFGYGRDRACRIQSSPYITRTPHDRKLLHVSQDIQKHLGFRCEIEYIISADGVIHVVQAKDISEVEILEQRESERSVRLDGVHRIRARRSFRERPIYVMDMEALYMEIIDRCEDLVHGWGNKKTCLEDIVNIIDGYQESLENFALLHHRFALLGYCLKAPEEIYQMAHHYLDETPELHKPLSQALHQNLYVTDYFIAEADTIIAKDMDRVSLCSHDAYGIDTVRNPLWSVYWHSSRHREVVNEFKQLGFRTGDTVGIDIDPEGKPTVFRL
jgi:hypothetical protein